MMKAKKPISVEAATNRAAALCARSEQAESDIRTKLGNWGLTPGEALHVIARLKAENFLNEERYAHAYCRDKFRFNGWGRIKIAFMLKGKGVGQPAIDAALAEIDPTQYREHLRALLQAKWRDVAAKEPAQARAALLRLAASRGYEPEVIYRAVDELLSHVRASQD